jgi:hypothetical protein
MKTSQNMMIAGHLMRKKSISWVEANDLYRVRSLTRRIADLRGRGWPIISEWKRDALGQRYTRYHLDVPKFQELSEIEFVEEI